MAISSTDIKRGIATTEFWSVVIIKPGDTVQRAYRYGGEFAENEARYMLECLRHMYPGVAITLAHTICVENKVCPECGK